MPLPVSDYLGVTRAKFDSSGAFNCVLDRDSLLFIDPSLARHSKSLTSVGEKITRYFQSVMTLLSKSKEVDDVFWKAAAKQLVFKEPKGTCLGYSRGTDGRGIGNFVRDQILQTAKEIVDAGILDAEVLELIALFEEGVGCDLVSDMITNIIFSDLVSYTADVLTYLDYPNRVPMRKVQLERESVELPINPINGQVIILVPQDMLEHLPVAYSFEDIDWVTSQNEKVRSYISKLVLSNTVGKRQTKLSKSEVRNLLLGGDKEILREIVEIYKKTVGVPYDYQNDPAGEIEWLWRAKEVNYAKDLTLPENPSLDDFARVIQKICEKFKHVVEQNKGWVWFYRADATPHVESAAQLLFYAVASSYCDANDLDCTPEANTGRGPVDFKISKGAQKRILIEVKLSSNNLIHGLTKQLPTYLQSADVAKGILLVIRIDDHKIKLATLENTYQKLEPEVKNRLSIFTVDARKKDSGSKTQE